MRETTDAEERLLEAVMVFLPDYRPGSSASAGSSKKSWRPVLSSVAVSAACIVGACLIAAVLPSPQHLPVSLTPFYMGVAAAVTLGAFLRCRNAGWYAFALALPAVYLDASVASLAWVALTVTTLAAIAAIRSFLDLLEKPTLLSGRGAPKPPQYALDQRKRISIVAHRISRRFAFS